MLTLKILNNTKLVRMNNFVALQHMCYRKYSDNVKKKPEIPEESNLKIGEVGAKYKHFKDEDAEIILDVYEEKLKYANQLEEDPEPVDSFEGINLTRGVQGVYDIEDLVELLRHENAVDIFVASIPANLNYADYICVVTGKSLRHMQAIVQFVRRVYKKKRNKYDVIPRIEGAESKDWKAIDLGNIVLHVFSKEARVRYDLDSLWTVGPEFDEEFNKKDLVVEMLEKHSIYLKEFVPAS